jgi:septal ring factor EnvC (AmiA/AmiB activator)
LKAGGERVCKRLLFAVLLLSACSPVVYSQGWQSAPEPLTLSESQRHDILRLIQELQTINTDLSRQLSNSQTDLQSLRASLTAAEQKFQTASRQLAALKQTSGQLSLDLAEQRESLNALQDSFNEYKAKAETTIKTMELERNIAALSGCGGIVMAIILGILVF